MPWRLTPGRWGVLEDRMMATVDIPLNLREAESMWHDQLLDYFAKGDAAGVMFSVGGNTRLLPFVFDNVLALRARGILEPCIVDAYTATRTNFAGWSLSAMQSVFDMADKAKLRAAGNPLPLGEQFTVYRGISGEGKFRKPSGYSWTDDLDRAVWFAKRYGLEDPAVYQATVAAADVLFFSNDRNERDFVFRTRRFKRLPIDPQTAPCKYGNQNT
jgi:hypothetical protein